MSGPTYENETPQFELELLPEGTRVEDIEQTVTATFAFVQNEAGEILTLKNERGRDIPGGHLDGDETVIEATHREVLEEGCVSITDLELFAVIKNGPTAMAVFRAKPTEIHKFKPDEVDPTSDRAWMTKADFRAEYSGGDTDMMDRLLAALP